MKATFSTDVMNGIESEVLTAFNAVPRRGAEVGGVLLGHRTGFEISINDFEPVLCEHRFGPSFHLSEADVRGLEDTLEWFRNRRDGMSVLGFYRSYTRQERPFDNNDAELLNRYFSAEDSLFLLLKPDRRQTVTAELFLCRGSEIAGVSEGGSLPLQTAIQITDHASTKPEFSRGLYENGGNAVPDSPPFPKTAAVPDLETPERVPMGLAPDPTAEPARPNAVELIEPMIASRPAALQARVLPEPTRPRYTPSEDPPPYRWYWGAAIGLLCISAALLGYRSIGSQPRLSSEGATVAPIPSGPRSTEPLPRARPTAQISPSSDRALPFRSEVGNTDEARSSAVMLDVQATLNRWVQAMRLGDPDAAAALYAPEVAPYFTRRDASPSDVRDTISKSLERYGRPVILRISNVRIALTGTNRAVAMFRKHWQTAGPRIFAGEEEERLALVRQNQVWKIASEEELRVFWTHRPARRRADVVLRSERESGRE